MKNEILIIPNKKDKERDAIAEVWEKQGGKLLRLDKFWLKPNIGNSRVTLYRYDSFCLVLAQVLEIEMMMPKDELLAVVDANFLKREVDIKTIASLDEIAYPKFVKPVIPKLFKAEIFTSSETLRSTIRDIDENEKLICSEVVEVEKELRSFILENEIQDLAFYEGDGDLVEARQFIERFLQEHRLDLPKSYVLDIGYNQALGWFIIEFNSAWGAGLNFCNPQKVMACIRTATIN